MLYKTRTIMGAAVVAILTSCAAQTTDVVDLSQSKQTEHPEPCTLTDKIEQVDASGLNWPMSLKIIYSRSSDRAQLANWKAEIIPPAIADYSTIIEGGTLAICAGKEPLSIMDATQLPSLTTNTEVAHSDADELYVDINLQLGLGFGQIHAVMPLKPLHVTHSLLDTGSALGDKHFELRIESFAASADFLIAIPNQSLISTQSPITEWSLNKDDPTAALFDNAIPVSVEAVLHDVYVAPMLSAEVYLRDESIAKLE